MSCPVSGLTCSARQDEFGHWLAYTFDGRGLGAAAAASPLPADSDWSVHSALLDSAGLKLAAGPGSGGPLDCGPGGEPGDPGGPLLHYLHSSLGLDTAARASPPLPPKHHYRLHVRTETASREGRGGGVRDC